MPQCSQPCVLLRGSMAGVRAGAPVSSPLPGAAMMACWRSLVRAAQTAHCWFGLLAPAVSGGSTGQLRACNTDACRLPGKPGPSWPPLAAEALAVASGQGGSPLRRITAQLLSLLLSTSPFCRTAGCVLQLWGFVAN